MITTANLKGISSQAVLSRARRVADEPDRFHVRTCRYEDDLTVLNAKVDASYSWDGAYRTSVVLDEEAGEVVDYDCDCPASRRFAGACKHVVALVLNYTEEPEAYRGHDEASHRQTSRRLTQLMERAETHRVLAATGKATEPHGGTVGLEACLSYETGFDVRFRLVGSSGAYVLKSVTDFVSDVESGSYRQYGKRLAFTHDRRAFSPASWPVVEFLSRAVQNRRAYAFERVLGHGRLSGNPSSPQRELHLSPPELWELLGMLRGTQVRFEDRSFGARRPVEHVLRIRDGNPEVRLTLQPLDDGSFELKNATDVRAVASGSHAVAWDAQNLYRCDDAFSGNIDLLSLVLTTAGESLTLAEQDVERFCVTGLPRLEGAALVDVPPELERLRPAPCKLEFHLDVVRNRAVCVATAVYGEARLPLFAGQAPSGSGTADPVGSGAARQVVRDRVVEAGGREVVRRYFPVGEGERRSSAKTGTEELARMVYEGVPELQRVGSVFVTPAVEHLRAKARPKVRIGLSVRSNLLDLTLSVEGASRDDLAGLLESYRLHKRYHRLKDGSILQMDNVDTGEVGAVVAELGLTNEELAAGHVVVPAYRALLLDGVSEEVDRDASLDRYLDSIRSIDLQKYTVPCSLNNVLRPYQVDGYRWLRGLAELGLGGILADEMGLGKSLQLISFLLSHYGGGDCEVEGRRGLSLIVCPASLVYNWQAEFKKFAPQIVACAVVGTAEQRHGLCARRDVDVFVTSYDLFRRDVAAYARMPLWCMALDEAQYIKNHETLAARAAKSVEARHRLALTGTPVENRLSELWSIFDFLMPGLFGSYGDFRERYERPIVEEDNKELALRMRTALKPFVLRRSKRDVLDDLPEKIEQVVYAHMGVEQRGVYDAQVQELRNQLAHTSDVGLGKEKIQVLAALTRLRQTCCDPHLVFEGYDGGSCKTDTVLTLVDRVVDAGEKMLLFSQFTSYLDILGEELRQRGVPFYMLTGTTPKHRRQELVDSFNTDDTPVFLISLKAGGTGLNLTGAQVVVHADPWWNVAAQNQATDRAHRIGQTREVTVYQVICAETLEDRIRELQDAKAALAETVIEGDTSGVSLASLTREDLAELLRS